MSYIFTHKVIEVVISLALVFGNKLRGFVDIFHQQIRKLPVHNVFNAICSSYLKRHSNLNSLRNAFTTNELNELNRTYIHIDPINLPEMDLPNSRTHASVVKLI